VIRLLICDESSCAREELRALLDEQNEIELVGEAADAEQAIALAAALAPDAVLLDAELPLADGEAAISRIKRLLPGVRIVALAGSADRQAVDTMIAAGADAYCVKGAPLWELERAVAGASDPLLRLAHALTRAPAGGVGAIVARELHDLTGGAVAAVYLATDARLGLAGAAGPLDVHELVRVPQAAARAFEECAPVSADEGTLSELVVRGASFRDAFALPLVSDGLPLGALLVAMPADLPYMLDVELIAAVADLAASAIASERLLLFTRTEARRDALTGLPNRRAFDERLETLLASESTFGLALIDLDNFKDMNDRLGHAVGDDVLCAFARVTQRTLRATEELYRLGGDEFALLLRSGETATHVVARIRQALHLHRRPRRLPTISAGIAVVPGDGRSKIDLLAHADRALYAAKRAGKDRTTEVVTSDHGARVLIVDDDGALRELLRTTLEAIDLEVAEAETAGKARAMLESRVPDLILLDVGLPDLDGLSFCHELKANPRSAAVPVVILTGADIGTSDAARAANADGFLRKPFSPLELLAVAERLLGRLDRELTAREASPPAEQVQLYAQDLRHLLELERGQRALLQHAYRQTVGALAAALESKDIGTGAHSHRVLRYATELARAVDPSLLDEQSAEYGFLLHDIGKIGIPDHILCKRGPLTPSERSLLETHTLLGEQMLAGVPLLAGSGLRIVRSHHERWDGTGYPDRLAANAIPLGARIFAVADTLDAMTSERPYRQPLPWNDAVAEIAAESGRQFDPDVVDAFAQQEPSLRRVYYELATG
jgi:diguanylate cyclase (GGDEF)-like protein